MLPLFDKVKLPRLQLPFRYGSSNGHDEIPLDQPGLTTSNYSIGSNSTVVASPLSPGYRRQRYRRVPSYVDESVTAPPENIIHSTNESGNDFASLGTQKAFNKLGITIGGRSSPSTPSSAHTLVSPSAVPKYQQLEDTTKLCGGKSKDDLYNATSSSPFLPYSAGYDQERLLGEPSSNFHTRKEFLCKSRQPVGRIGRRCTWLLASLLSLSTYATIFSGIWFFVAVVKPQYGQSMRVLNIAPQTATVLSTAFAKSIELAFVTVFVAVLGQVLSKRALGVRGSISIAEMSMRSWVMQPGSMLAHWESVRYAAITSLGTASLLATLLALLYTTASDALVAPKVRFGKPQDRVMFGKVGNSLANASAIRERCMTPIPKDEDPDSKSTCVAIAYSGEAYSDYMQYLGTWMGSNLVGQGSLDMAKRPPPVGTFDTGTNVTGAWIHTSSTGMSKRAGRTVTNVSMVMPHAGVVKASEDPRNRIVQMGHSGTAGQFEIHASVPSPEINVLCAEMAKSELTPMVYSEWPRINDTYINFVNQSWPGAFNLSIAQPATTSVDSLFGFSEQEVYPIFPKLPIPNNTVFNHTMYYGTQAVYLLGTARDGAYTLCSMRMSLNSDCSTKYQSGGTGRSLQVNCDEDNPHAYRNSNPVPPNGTWTPDWVSVAAEWGTSLSLTSGITDANASNARLLTQLIPKSSTLERFKPSISEALAVLAGCTLLDSGIDAPFVPFWNYSKSVDGNIVDLVPLPQYQIFNATVATTTYQSGPNESWQNVFYLVLALMFGANLGCLGYLAFSKERTTDFLEPQNLFCLSLLSPPDQALEGACGGGPAKEHYASRWSVKVDRSREHQWFESKKGNIQSPSIRHKHHWSSPALPTGFETERNLGTTIYDKVSERKSSRL